MSAKIIDGKVIAEQVRSEAAAEVAKMAAAGKPRPGLATVLVGDNPASHMYVKNKRKSCEDLGIISFGHELPATTPQEELDALVSKLNADPKVNGILVQLPLLVGQIFCLLVKSMAHQSFYDCLTHSLVQSLGHHFLQSFKMVYRTSIGQSTN